MLAIEALDLVTPKFSEFYDRSAPYPLLPLFGLDLDWELMAGWASERNWLL